MFRFICVRSVSFYTSAQKSHFILLAVDQEKFLAENQVTQSDPSLNKGYGKDI